MGTPRSEPSAHASAGASGRHNEPGFSAGLHVPHAATKEICKAPRATGTNAPTRSQEVRQRGTQPATTTAQDQMPSNGGRRLPQTRTARATPAQPRHARWCQATPNRERRARHEDPPPPEEPEEQRRGIEAEEKQRSGDGAEGRPGDETPWMTRRPGQEHPGPTKQQEAPPPGLEHPETSGGHTPTKGATGAEQAGGAAATPDWNIQGQVAVDSLDWNMRAGASSASRRPADWSIREQVAEDAPERIIRGKTRRRRTAGERRPGAQGKIVRGGTSERSPRPPDKGRKQHKGPHPKGALKQGRR